MVPSIIQRNPTSDVTGRRATAARKVTVPGCATSSLFVAFTAWIGNCGRTPSGSLPSNTSCRHPSGSTALARIISGADGLPGGPAGPIKPSPAGRKQPPGRNRPIACGPPRARRAARHILKLVRDRLWHDSRLLRVSGSGQKLGSGQELHPRSRRGWTKCCRSPALGTAR